jgi:hypothetical protein
MLKLLMGIDGYLVHFKNPLYRTKGVKFEIFDYVNSDRPYLAKLKI